MQQQYEASLSHFNSEKFYLSGLDHPHIIKIYETQENGEINVPSYIQSSPELS